MECGRDKGGGCQRCKRGGGEPVVMEEVVLEVKGEDGGGFWFGGLTGSTPWVDWAFGNWAWAMGCLFWFGLF